MTRKRLKTLPEVDPEDSNTMITAELQNSSNVSSQIMDSKINVKPGTSTQRSANLFDISDGTETSPQIDF